MTEGLVINSSNFKMKDIWKHRGSEATFKRRKITSCNYLKHICLRNVLLKILHNVNHIIQKQP